MKKMTVILSAILAVQVVLAGILLSQDQGMGAFQSKKKLLGLELAKLNQVTIEAKDKKVVLKKQQGKWQLPDHFNAPVDTNKLQKLTDKLFTLPVSWPVATTEDAAARFKVAKDEFEGKISFVKTDGTAKTLYLGSSPGFKKIHARVDGQAAIYSIAFAAYEAPVNIDDWVDKNLLAIDIDSINKVETDKLTLIRDGKVWQIGNLEEDKIADQEKINAWLQKLAKLQFNAILGSETKPEYGLDKPVFAAKLMPKSGEPINLAIGKMNNDYIIKSSSQPFYFKTGQYQVQALIDVGVNKFSAPKPVAGTKSEDKEKTDKEMIE